MLFKQGMALIITIVDSGFSSKVIEASKNAGADGATILSGRGTSIHENATIMGVAIQPEKEVVLSIVKKSSRKNIMKEIVRVCNLNTEGKGLTFCLPVDEIAGSPHLFKRIKEKDKNKKKDKNKDKTESKESVKNSKDAKDIKEIKQPETKQ